jgi:hypothetical protein
MGYLMDQDIIEIELPQLIDVAADIEAYRTQKDASPPVHPITTKAGVPGAFLFPRPGEKEHASESVKIFGRHPTQAVSHLNPVADLDEIRRP